MFLIAEADPEQLLQSLGIRSHTLRQLVIAVVLLGLLSAGLKLMWSVGNWSLTVIRRRRADPEDLQRLRYRQLFARHIANRIGDLDNKEEWADHRFAELEAEIETLGDHRSADGMARYLRRRGGLRREKSLSRALRRSREPLVLLQGDPGSGKSVALRFVTRRMAEAAMQADSLDAVIPLYVNLKALQPGPVDAQRIHDFVTERLTEGTDRDVQEYLEDNFVDGLRRGTWLFLFDSFDEIPDILSATEPDETVHTYSEAIIAFMHGLNRCRGVIASRAFRAPARRDLPRYRIVPLSESRRRELIKKANLAPVERDVLLELPSATPDLIALTENAMFLGLLCEYIRGRIDLPAGWHEVFEAYVSHRLDTDAGKLERLFGTGPDAVRERSEQVAFTMTASGRLGLSPTREDLIAEYEAAGFPAADGLGRVMDALEWSKLARSETSAIAGSSPTFTFAHRRFQEYFATCVVLREPELVTVHRLLTDGAWRETAVTMFQTQEDQATALIMEVERLVDTYAAQLEATPERRFTWPPGLLHILNLLQNGFAGHIERLPGSLSRRVGDVLRLAFERGTITDRKWALEVAGTAPPEDLAKQLRAGFRGRSRWLRDVASRQAARLSEIPDDLAGDIRAELVLMLSDGRLQRDWLETRAQLQRLHPAGPFVRAAQLLRIVPLLDAVALTVVAALAASTGRNDGPALTLLAAVFAVGAWAGLRPLIAAGPPFRLMVAQMRPSLRQLRASLRRPSTAVRQRLARGRMGADRTRGASFRRLLGGTGDAKALASAAVWYAGGVCRSGLVVLACETQAGDVDWRRAALSAYLVSWGLALVVAVWSGVVSRWASVLPMPLLLVRLLRRIRPRHAVFLPIIAAIAAAYGAMLYGISWLVDHSAVGKAVLLAGALVGTAFTGAWLAGTVLDDARDRVWHRRWEREEHGPLTGERLVELLTKRLTSAGAERLVRDVRRRRLIAEAPDGEAVVRDLLASIERPDADHGAAWSSPAMTGGGSGPTISGARR